MGFSQAIVLCALAGTAFSAQLISAPASADCNDAADPSAFGGPSSVASQIQSDQEAKATVLQRDVLPHSAFSYTDFKERLRTEHGFSFGLDYNLLFQYASESLDKQHTAGGVLRLYGTASVFEPESGHPGAIEFKVENRHRLGTQIAPTALAGEIGYAGLTAVPFSDAGWLLTNLYWHQSLRDNRLAYILGIVDVTDYVGVYGLVNPWTDFINLAFSTDPTTPAPDQGLGTAVRWNPAEHYYVLAGLADATGNPREPADGIDAFLRNGETFKHLEAGWFGSWKARFEDNIHLTLWQADERSDAGVPDGWGAQCSFSRRLRERWLPFLRVGYANGSGAALDRSVSTGFAYNAPGRDTVFGLGVNWGRPNQSGSGTATATATEDQYTVEAYYRVQLFDRLAITPDLQLIKNPAANPDADLIWIAGLRARLAF
ncbi:MAG: carbohydrate porin [Thiohalocapsa sp.]